MTADATRDHPFLRRLRAARGRPLVIAHRGDSFHGPENTLEAARLAFEAGADAWEFDVQLTRDGVPVVLHDETLTRTTDVARRFAGDPREADGFRLADFDLDEVRTLDAGSWFLSGRGGPRTAAGFGTAGRLAPGDRLRYGSGAVRVPSLRECLDETARSGWLANVEVKSFPGSDPRLLASVIREVVAAGVADRVLLSSFDHDDVAGAAASGHPVAAGALTATPIHRPDRYVGDVVSAHCYHPSASVLGAESARYLGRPCPENLRTGDLDALAGRGIPVLVYTVNDARPDGLAAHLALAGVSALFTDDPRGLRRLFGEPPS